MEIHRDNPIVAAGPQQKLTTTTTCHFDWWDRLRIFFGNQVQVVVTVAIPQEKAIPHYIAQADVKVLGHKSRVNFRQDRQGYTMMTVEQMRALRNQLANTEREALRPKIVTPEITKPKMN